MSADNPGSCSSQGPPLGDTSSPPPSQCGETGEAKLSPFGYCRYKMHQDRTLCAATSAACGALLRPLLIPARH